MEYNKEQKSKKLRVIRLEGTEYEEPISPVSNLSTFSESSSSEEEGDNTIGDVNDILDVVNYTLPPEKSFKINNKWLFLTYADVSEQLGEEDEKLVRKEFEAVCKLKCKPKPGTGREMTGFLCAMEHHKNGNLHFHVIISYSKPLQTTNCRFFDIDFYGRHHHPCIRRVKTMHDYTKVVDYISKEDKKIQKKEISQRCRLAKQIWNCDSLAEALILPNVGDLKIHEIKLMWEAKPEIHRETKYELPDFGWYKTLLKCAEIEDHRTVYWFCEMVGNLGKSALSYHLSIEKKAHIIKNVGRMADFAQNIRNAIQGGWDMKCLILDLPRGLQDRKTVYEAIECVKDGIITCSKYDSRTITLTRKPTVIVTANWWPNFSQLSIDRWKCFKIEDINTCTKVPIKHIIEKDDEEEYYNI